MTGICYMVTATLPSEAVAEEYVAWLRDGHVAQVIAGGARTGMIVRLDVEAGGLARVMTQYVFASRTAFDQYVRQHAPALGGGGLRRCGAETGGRLGGAVGEVGWGGGVE